MKPLRVHTGTVAPLDRANVDTDQIVPKQFLKRVERSGYGNFLFYDWAHQADGTRNSSFVLNEPRYSAASILLAGRNFGCGSSREHAAWALLDYGFRAIIAPSFADIFATNCAKNGIVAVVLPESEVAELVRRAQAQPGYSATVDMEKLTVYDQLGFSASFQMLEFRRQCLLQGLDEIALTLQHDAEITAYETSRSARFWLPTIGASA